MPRCSVLVLALFMATACDRRPTAPQLDSRSTSALAKEDVGPPPARAFGPDSRETEGPNSGQGISNDRLTCTAGSDARTFAGYLESDVDHTLLDATLQLPTGVGPFPLVVLLHGWAGSKTTSGEIADMLVASGYGVLRYSARGFGDSWGKANPSDLEIELRDLQSMIGRVAEQSACAIDAQAVAVTGASYGGGQSWLAAAEPVFRRAPESPEVHIRTVLPIAAWTDLLYSLMPNGRPRNSLDGYGGLKLSFVNGLFVSGLRKPDKGPQPWYPNYPKYLLAWDAYLDVTEPTRADPVMGQIADGLAGYRSIWWQQRFWAGLAINRVPIFQVQGFTDDLFPLEEAKRMLLAITSLDASYPIASYFGDLGHPRASNKGGEIDYVLRLMRDWLAFYLKGEGSPPTFAIQAAITRPPEEPFAPANVLTFASWDDLATATVRQKFHDTAVLVNPVNDPYEAFYWDPLVREGAKGLEPYSLPFPPPIIDINSLGVYEAPVDAFGRGALLIAGQPEIELKASSTAPRVQLNVRLYDVAPDGSRSLITRGTYTIDAGVGLPANGKVTIPTYGNLWNVPADHRLRLEITNLDSPYISPSKVASVTTISHVELTLPVR